MYIGTLDFTLEEYMLKNLVFKTVMLGCVIFSVNSYADMTHSSHDSTTQMNSQDPHSKPATDMSQGSQSSGATQIPVGTDASKENTHFQGNQSNSHDSQSMPDEDMD
jgi:hypothetical protein